MGYVVEAHVARGGMGDVHRARVEATGELVAIKVMRPVAENGGDAESSARERFAREARVLSGLEHPDIVRYVAHGTTVDGRPYIAFEWIEGETLHARLAGRRLSVREAAVLGARLAGALAAAHAAGAVHRDVKPSNVIMTADDGLKLVDFGVAKVAVGAETLTRDGAVVGTHGYMSPEQLRGSPDVGTPADVFGLGCVLYRALAGRLPWDTERLALLVDEVAPNVRARRPDVPEAFADTIACMLHTDARARPTASEVKEQLGRVVLFATDAPPPASRADAALRSEQALVTVVAVAASTSDDPTLVDPPARAAPEDTASLIRAFFEERGARAEIVRSGPCLAIFGPTPALAEQVNVAARAALAARDVARGRAVSLTTGRAEVTGRSATGDAVFRAIAYLQRNNASATAVATDEASASLLASRFVVAQWPEGPSLIEERHEPEAARTVCGRVVPLFGRDDELGALYRIAAEAFAGERGASALVVAPAGAGKSRLAAELAIRLQGALAALEVVTVRSDPLGSSAPFAGAAAITRALARIPFEPAARTSGASLDPFIAHLAGSGASFAHDEALRAARVDPTLMRVRLRDAFREVVGRASSSSPLLLILDDVQWVDAASLRLVDDVITCARGRFAVVALARPEIHDGPALLASISNVIELKPLSADASRSFARAVLGDDARDSVVDRIVRLGDGHSFFLEELARAAATGGVTSLPDSVVALTHARFGALPALERQVLRAASLVRPRVTADAVAHLLGAGAVGADVGATLEELVRREILVRDDAAFAFRHDLLAEAAYASLTEDDAREGHLATAAFLSRSADADPLKLAEHLERGGDRAGAAEAHARAAELMLRSGDVDGAVACAERAIACDVSGGSKGRVLAVRAAVERWHGDLSRAVALGTEALALLDPEDATYSEAASEIASAAGSAGDEAALAKIARDLTAGPAAAQASRIRALAATALSLVRAGQISDADLVLARAESMRASLERDHAIADIGLHGARAARRTYAGDPSAYVVLMPAVIESARRLGDERTACLALAHRGYGLGAVGAWDDAEVVLREALAEADRLASPAGRASVLHNLARVRDALGDAEEGAALQEQALIAALEQRNARLATACRLYTAQNRAATGRHEEALVHARLAREAARERPLRAWADAILAEILVDVGEAGEALAHARAAHGFFVESGGIGEGDSCVHRALARALLAAGESEAARAAASAAHARLQVRAAMIDDPTLRRSFLERVRENADVVALCSVGRRGLGDV